MFDNFNVNLRKNEGFPTDIPCIPIPDYGQSNAPFLAPDDKEQFNLFSPKIKTFILLTSTIDFFVELYHGHTSS